MRVGYIRDINIEDIYEDLDYYTSRLTTMRGVLTGGYVINGVAYVSMQCT